MSQRLYTGPAPSRGSSPVLNSLAWLLAVVTIGLQIYYPLAAATDHSTVAIAVVVAFFLASLTHASMRHGIVGFLLVGIVVPAIGLAAEAIGTRTGWPFGDYQYGDVLGATILDVPVVVPMAWSMMAYPTYVAAATLTQRRWLIPFIGGWSLMAWDVFLDPMMIELGGWTWSQPTSDLPFLTGIPVQNFLGWFGLGVIVTAVLLLLPRPRASKAQPSVMYLWVYASSVVGNAFYFDRPEVAVAGGIAMGVIALPFAWRLWTART